MPEFEIELPFRGTKADCFFEFFCAGLPLSNAQIRGVISQRESQKMPIETLAFCVFVVGINLFSVFGCNHWRPSKSGGFGIPTRIVIETTHSWMLATQLLNQCRAARALQFPEVQ
jgi:hypothetical protein